MPVVVAFEPKFGVATVTEAPLVVESVSTVDALLIIVGETNEVIWLFALSKVVAEEPVGADNDADIALYAR